MYTLVDTHCHLNHERFADDVPESIDRAREAGVSSLLVVGYDMSSSRDAVRLAETYEGVYAAIAVHPHDAQTYSGDAERELVDLAANPRVVAIGEIGLDFHYDLSPHTEQRHAFVRQIEVARRCSLPVIVHCRDAYDEALGTLHDAGAGVLGCVMHCWAGTPEQAACATDYGFYLGFGGMLAFKSADDVRAAARNAPAECILVETDAPYLAPVPYRGRRNEPAFVALVAHRLAELREVSAEEAAGATSSNALRLFRRMA